jgi:thiamine biosynthesis lipoprotein
MSAEAMATTRSLTTTRRPAMGAEIEITTDASTAAIDAVLAIAATFESRWSRFVPGNELALLNASGRPTIAQPSTARILEVALAGRRLTHGWFDPTRGVDIRVLGYDRDHAEGWTARRDAGARRGDVDIDPSTGLIHIPDGVEVDLGGIAKGWTADRAATILRESGATQVGVGIGGDVRVRSDTRVLVELAFPGNHFARPARLGLRDGGVAVSGPSKRRAGDGRHHLIDPFSGRCAVSPGVAVAIAATAAGAEMIATAAAIAPLPEAIDFIYSSGATAWLVEQAGARTTVGQPERYVVDPGWLADAGRRRWARERPS